ncbi:MAG: sigma-70 family RNA polymerase sigma factor [Gemmatales bacterium]|nr:sigma-70 family RNA polymerase sigma factor [Gemmatales bacterium]MDW8386301.1 sigma-70 family RNA polymerase sigma factor [Gemmatales bacterium]
MALVAVDRQLLQRCLTREPGAWNDFVDRFLGLIYHVIHYTAHLRSVALRPEDVEDLAAEILLQIVADDYAVLRRFRGKSSLATYLTVVARRICIHELTRRSQSARTARLEEAAKGGEPEAPHAPAAGLDNVELAHMFVRRLPRPARDVVRLFYLEGRSYEEISTQLRIPVNSIGPILARAKKAMRKKAQEMGLIEPSSPPKRAAAEPPAEASTASASEPTDQPAPASSSSSPPQT